MLYWEGMKSIRHIAILALFLAVFVPSVTYAKTLTNPQVNAIVQLLVAFGVDLHTIDEVRAVLTEKPKAAKIIIKEEPVEEPTQEDCTITTVKHTSRTVSC